LGSEWRGFATSRASSVSIFCRRPFHQYGSSGSGRWTHSEELLEGIIDDTHVGDGIEESDTLRESTTDFLHALESLHASIEGLEVLGEEDTDVTDSVESREQDGDDCELAILACRTRSDSSRGCGRSLRLLGGGGTRRTVEEDVDDVHALRGLGRREGLALDPESLLVVDDDSPAKVEVVVLDADESARLEEGESVGGMVENVTEILLEDIELLSELVVVGDALLVLDHDRSLGHVQRLELCRRHGVSERTRR
jgi:hypothetical protein